MSYKTLIILVVLAVSGCGFRPLNHPNLASGTVTSNIRDIRIEFVSDRIGQILRNALLDRLNPYGEPDVPRYTLIADLNETEQSLGIRKDDSSTRANLLILAGYKLVDAQTGQVVTTGSFRSVNSYNILASEFATQNARENARKRGAEQVADHIETRLSLFFLRQAEGRRSGS